MEENKKDELQHEERIEEVATGNEAASEVTDSVDNPDQPISEVPKEDSTPAVTEDAKTEETTTLPDEVKETEETPKDATPLEAKASEALESKTEKKDSAVNEEDQELDVVSGDVNEVETDEHEHDDEYAHEHKELPDYAHMPIDKLLDEAKRTLEGPVNEIKEEVEAIYKVAMDHFDHIRKEKLHAFVEGGGVEMDFTLEQPQKREFQSFYKDYKAKRYQYYKNLEEQLAVNLDVKKSIVEAIKELPESPGIVKDKYATFRELQDRWKSTGPVPRAESRELWNNYHFHVDNFYDFLKISDELRELDFKKNLEKKTALCEEAEALAEKDVTPETFKQLQELHAKWKQIGPVDREQREPIWERFSAATRKIHENRHEFFKDLRASREELLERKKEILKKFEDMSLDDLNTHSAWQGAIKAVNKLRDEFKAIGRINLPGNDEVWELYREVNQRFNRTKNAFYKTLKHEHHENLKRKRDLLAKAEELKNSTDWKITANKLKKIQSDWKRIGYVPKSESDKIWKEFRKACNHFFNRLTEHNKELDKAFEANLETKKVILEKLKVWKAPAGKKAVEELKAMIVEWKNAGRIPRAAREIEAEFNGLLDKYFGELKINKKEASMIRFENKMHGLVSSENDRQLDREEDLIRRKLDEAKKELVQLENNIQFFAHVDENNPIVKEANRNIDRQKEQIELLKNKLKMLRKIAKEGITEQKKETPKTTEETPKKEEPSKNESGSSKAEASAESSEEKEG